MYKKKCLFRNSNASWGNEASALESVWAYLFGVEKKSTGRYRIRISKMSGEELVAMGLAPEETPPTFFGLQATLDKWHADRGWIPAFDWVGDPDASLHKIEKDLNKQFQAFVTGIASDEDFSFDLPKSPIPEKNTFKTPSKKPKDPSAEDIISTPEVKTDDSDIEWI